jgi:hypothetical protein
MSHRKLITLLTLIAIVFVSCRAGTVAPTQPAPIEETPVSGQTPTQEPAAPGPSPTGEPTSPPVGPAAITYAIPVVDRGAGFAAYEPVPAPVEPSVLPYPTALSGLVNPDAALPLNPAQQATLEQNGFVVTPAPFGQIYQVYQTANEQGQPIFVTTDALLHTYHILYDFALRDAEINHFVGDLQALTAEMLAQSQAQMGSTDGDAQRAAFRNLAYFSLAASLLDPTFAPPPEVADLVSAELALIQAHSGFQPSPIFGYEAPLEYIEDYSQYVPRGHYTRNETFERYFRAMMWYGRIGFRLRPGDRPDQVEMGRMETRQAILIAAALGDASVNGEPALAVWDRIYEPTVFFVGGADDLTVYDYLHVMRTAYGDTFNPQDLNDVARLDTFIQQAASLRPPRIVGGYVTDQEDPTIVTQGFRFMGQRFVPDSYIFQQLVYDKVGTQDNPRLMPYGLDVASGLGSERAYDILLNVYGQGQYANYAQQMEAVRAEFAGLPPEQWSENLYWGWLHSLAPLLSPVGEGYPIFMQSPAWVNKDLHTYLGSWTELKHDTILYAKQSTTMMATSIMPEPERVNGYVEPRPEVFARLAALASQTRRGLDQRGLLSDEFRDKFSRLESLLFALKEMAVKELRNESLTEEEQAQIRNIGDTLEGLTTFLSQTEEELASETDERLAIVADVHTDPNTNQVLEEGVGDAFLIWVIAPVDGRPTLTQGGVFSYYEFTWPLADRLTDEAWQSLEPKPDQPMWTESFVVP